MLSRHRSRAGMTVVALTAMAMLLLSGSDVPATSDRSTSLTTLTPIADASQPRPSPSSRHVSDARPTADGAENTSREAGDRLAGLVVGQVDGELPAGIPLPGQFEAEDYRDGGPGVGYHDTTPGNAGKRYRQDDVDIQTCDDAESLSPCHNVGWIRGGEWLAYDVTVAEAGNYAVSLRTATPQSNRFARVEVNGAQDGPSIPIPNTGSFETWTTTAPITISLEAGNQTLRIVAETSSFNLNWISVTAIATGGGEDVVMVGAGDIANCLNDGDEATASLLDDIQGTVFTTGDNAYPDGTAENFADCYEPSWGRHKARTRPAVGNHEYIVPDASAYFDYFGAAAGEPGKGWYSYDLAEWHVVVLNSNCSKSGGCDADDPQAVWLATDLAAHASECTVAIWHHPRYSSGHHGSDANMQTFWEIAYAAGVELVINGHDHAYERFAPLDASGNLDRESGIRQIVAGTGGGSHHEMGDPIPHSEASNDDTFGVLKLTLSSGNYTWEFIPIAGSTFTDSGSDSCH
ncbi:MAG: carbohydrate-binding domain-containing protein [Thermomicrobiales bacterium]